MSKVNWVIHHILDNPMSYHTHGLDKISGYELEILLNLEPKTAGKFLHCIADSLMNGLKLEDGLRVEGIFNVPIYFFKTQSAANKDNIVYRVVFPDENGLYSWVVQNGQMCAEGYKDQIKFDKSKVFLVIIEDYEKAKDKFREENGIYRFEFEISDFFLKDNKLFCCPIAYFVPDDNFILCSYIESANFEEEIRKASMLYRDFGFRFVCKDLDTVDIMNKSFIHWCRNLALNDPIRLKVIGKEEG